MREAAGKYGFVAKKKLGQHFLVDGFVLEKILAGAEIGKGDLVLEIGPGLGGLTQLLAERAGHVVAVELDRTLCAVLSDVFAEKPVTVVQGDILRTPLAPLLAGHGRMRAGNLKAVANLPYYITTPVIFMLLEGGFRSITVMVQKEVACRMSARPSTKDYGALSLAVQYHADVTLLANVPANCFMPRPAVDSAVVRLDALESPRAGADKEAFFKVVRAAFGKRRKTLVNCLEGLGHGKAWLARTLEGLGIAADARGEQLDMGQFAQVARALEMRREMESCAKNRAGEEARR